MRFKSKNTLERGKMTGKLPLPPKNFEDVIARASAIIVDLDDRGEIVVGRWLLDDLDLLAAAFFAGPERSRPDPAVEP